MSGKHEMPKENKYVRNKRNTRERNMTEPKDRKRRRESGSKRGDW